MCVCLSPESHPFGVSTGCHTRGELFAAEEPAASRRGCPNGDYWWRAPRIRTRHGTPTKGAGCGGLGGENAGREVGKGRVR